MPMPVSVLFPDELRGRIERLARKRTVGVSTAIRTLVEERLSELEREEDAREIRRWQGEQALASWAAYEATGEVVAWEAMEQVIDEAVAAGGAGRRASPPRSQATSVTRSPGSSRKTAKRGRKG